MTVEWFKKRFGERLKGGTAFIAEYDDVPIGYVIVTTEERPQVGLVAYISGICVLPRVQRQGIGTRLMKKALTWIRDRVVVLVENDDEIIESPIAVKFFKKLGFYVFHEGAYMFKDLRLPDPFDLSRIYEVREHQLEDVDDLMLIRKEAFKEFGSWYNIKEEGFKHNMRDRIGRDYIKVYVATKDNELTGYVICQIRGTSRKNASIRNISVLPKYRKMGVGSALMARSFDYLRKNKVIRVGTVTETAEGFYKKVGFKVDARYVAVRKWINKEQEKKDDRVSKADLDKGKGVKAIVTKEDIKRGLKQLGLKKGDIVGVHSSLSSFGYVEGGADTVVDALLETVGEEGTLVMPTYSSNREKVERTERERELGVTWKARMLPYDPKKTSVWTGIIADAFRKRDGAVRDADPTHSLTAIGARASDFIDDWDSLLEVDGYILLIGVGLGVCSAMHLAEKRVQLPQHIQKKHEPPKELIDKYGENLGWPEWDIGFGPYPDFSKMEEPCKKHGIMKTIRIGDSEVKLLKLRELVDLYADYLRKNPDMFYE